MPEFQEITHDCQYKFVWRTSLVCPTPAMSPDADACHVRHNEAKTNIQLSPLFRPEGYQVEFKGKIYFVNVCGPVCMTSGVCTDADESYGLSKQSQFTWESGKLILNYYGGDSCSYALTRKKTTSIYFECNMSAGYGHPRADSIMEELDCMAVFVWPNNITCLESIYGPTTTTTTTTTTSSPGEPPVPYTTAPSATNSSSSSGKISGDTSPSEGGLSGGVTAMLVMLALVVVGCVVAFLVRSGHGARLVNRVKMATVTTHYSSRWSAANENANLITTNHGSRLYNQHDDGDEAMLTVVS